MRFIVRLALPTPLVLTMLGVFSIIALLLATAAVATPPSLSKHSLLNSFMQPSLSSPTTRTAAPLCGIDSYDFSTLMSSDWYGLSDDYDEIYYLNLCHTVQNLWCTLNPNTANVQLCQVSPDDTEFTYNLMSNDTSATQWSYINGQDVLDGIQFKSQTGDASAGCPNNSNRITIGQLVCGNSTGVVAEVVESPPCTYTLTLPNSIVCQAGQAVDQYAVQVERVRQARQSLAA